MIRIIKFREVQESTIKAYFTISVEKWGDFFIKDIKLFEKNGHRWIAFPDQKYVDKEGNDKWAPHCGFLDKAMKEKFEVLVLEAVDRYLHFTNPTSQPEIPF